MKFLAIALVAMVFSMFFLIGDVISGDIYIGNIAEQRGDFRRAFKEYLEVANEDEADSKEAKLKVGLYYFRGKGVPRDFKKARKWFKAAANEGVALAQNYLGMIYKNGLGIKPNDTLARVWFYKSAVAGNIPARFNLGEIYRENGRMSMAALCFVSVYLYGNRTMEALARKEMLKFSVIGWARGADKEIAQKPDNEIIKPCMISKKQAAVAGFRAGYEMIFR